MKITKSKLKQIILEEIQQDEEMLEAIEKLTDSIENLDVSMDFLASIFTGDSGVSIGAAQKQLGRAYRPKRRAEPVAEALGMDQQGQLSTKVVPLLMQIAGGNKSVALEMVDELSTLVDQLPDEEDLDEGFFGGDFGKKKDPPSRPEKTKRTPAEDEKLNAFLRATDKKMKR